MPLSTSPNLSLRLDARSLAKFTPRRLSMAVAELPHYELITETVADNFAIKVSARAVLLTLSAALSCALLLLLLFFHFLFVVRPSASQERYAPSYLPAPAAVAIAAIPTNNGNRDEQWLRGGLIWFRTVMGLTGRENQANFQY